MKILITGGAGYIGSTVAWMFVDRGHEVTIIDSLIKGKLSNIPKKSNFIKSDISNLKILNKYLDKNYDVVLHFAALINNEESIYKKKLYFDNNYNKSKIFLKFCIKKGIRNFIFSSSASVYGSSNKKVKEVFNTRPLTPYAQSKLKFEKFLEKFQKEMNYVILRYFNVAGVEKKMRCGFQLNNNKSLFHNLCKSHTKDQSFKIFGNKMNTKDGTAIRDFIYISDLAEVHYKFAKILKKKKLKLIVNCGYGDGYSVLEIVNKFNSLIKKKIKYLFKSKRKNEIEYSVADTNKLSKFYIFKKKNRLLTMIKTSIIWYNLNLRRSK